MKRHCKRRSFSDTISFSSIRRIAQEDYNKCLDALIPIIPEAKTRESAAIELQHRFENLVSEEKEITDKAMKGKFTF